VGTKRLSLTVSDDAGVKKSLTGIRLTESLIA